MLRWTLALVLALGFLSPMVAAPSTQKQSTKPSDPPAAQKADEVDLEENDQFNVTQQTEVVLDGRQSSYDEVPDNAIIVRMEVSPDRRTIVRVVFRSR